MLGFHSTNTLCNLAPLSGVPNRVLHYHKSAHSPRFSTIAVPNQGKYDNAVLMDHRILQALGFDSDPPRPKLVLSPKEREHARHRLLAASPDLDAAACKLLGLLPGGSRVTKRYPKDLWVDLLDRIAEARPGPIAVFADRQLSLQWGLTKICSDRAVALFDNLSLRELMGVLSWTDVVISNDSGPRHMAAALGARTVTLFGPSEVGEWHPYNPAEHPVLRVTVPCRDLGPQDLEGFRYCTVPECGHLSCLRQIEPEDIWSAAHKLLDSTSAQGDDGSAEP
jgi:ADP-heptose:LPS heptosyltransferase